MTSIPRTCLYLSGNEEKYIREAVRGQHLSGDGPYTKACTGWLEKNIPCHKALLTPSCTAALEMSALLCDLKLGDEVIMPSFTFSSSATAFVLRGAIPVFVDIDQATLNIDPKLVADAVTTKTKAILPVHYAGIGCDMDSIMNIAEQHRLFVIEDAAQSICASYKGRPLGGIGHLGCLSFHESKNVHCGEGGAILVNDPRFLDRSHIIREKGTNRTAFMDGAIDKYTWVDVGSSYLPSELNAAFLLAQLESAQDITINRRNSFDLYYSLLQPIAEASHFRLPHIPGYCSGNAHIFYIVTDSLKTRTSLSAFLKTRKIATFFHYIPLHSSIAGLRYGRVHGSMKQTDHAAAGLLRMPMHVGMPKEDIVRVAEAIAEFYSQNKYAQYQALSTGVL